MPRRLLDRIPNKREFLARTSAAIGGLRLLEQLARWRHPQPSLVVLTYHRIAVPGIAADPYYDPVISATPEAFRAQIRFLARSYEVLGLDAVAAMTEGSSATTRTKATRALITFDDGYRDNVEIAWPILRDLGVPAAFFLPTGLIDAPRLPWWDHVAHAIKRTSAPILKLDREPGDPAPIVIDLGRLPTDAVRTAGIMRIIGQFLVGAIRDERGFLARLDEQAEVAIDTEALGRDLFMSWDQARQIAASGMLIGSHGHSHQALAKLDEDAQRHELAESRKFLEERLGREVTAIAYPYGWHGTFTARTLEMAREVGYRLGFSSIEGINHSGGPAFEPMSLRRLNVGAGDSPPLLRARVALHGAMGWSSL